MTISVAGQNTASVKWTRFEAGKELAFSLPPGSLVDTREDETGLHIMCFYEGARIDFRMYDDENALENLLVPEFNRADSVTFEIDKLTGLRTINRIGAHVTESFYLASDSRFYHLTVERGDRGRSVVAGVFYSIRVNGRAPYARPPADAGTAAGFPEPAVQETISLDNISSSAETVAAYDRKYKKRDIDVIYEPMQAFKEDPEPPAGVRIPFVLQRPVVELKLRSRLAYNRSFSFEAKLKANFLANGEVGDITVYSNAPREFGEACVDSLRRSKFVPAQAGGKSIDMVFTDECKVASVR
jgi:hypothetical protein